MKPAPPWWVRILCRIFPAASVAIVAAWQADKKPAETQAAAAEPSPPARAILPMYGTRSGSGSIKPLPLPSDFMPASAADDGMPDALMLATIATWDDDKTGNQREGSHTC